ncbi:MAG: hypothetical protein EOP52_05780 [Sphingobacteriales bacterium]|nr:MAG: hypothetical protein EOP52_05780 [Sphingobacteriales bacterium]
MSSIRGVSLRLIFAAVTNPRIPRLLDFLKATPDDPFLNHALALEWIKEGDDTQAHTLFEKTRQVAPQYVATYYHLGKLLERQGVPEAAATIFEEGLQAAKAAGDMHSFNELRGALDEILDY